MPLESAWPTEDVQRWAATTTQSIVIIFSEQILGILQLRGTTFRVSDVVFFL